MVNQVLNVCDSLDPKQFIPQRIARNTIDIGQQSFPNIVTLANQEGSVIPNLAKRPTKYDVIALERAAETAPYLGSKNQPIIHAGNSPNVE